MAADDITTLREELPEVFEDLKPPDGWDDYHIIPVDVDGDSGFELDESSEDIGGRIGQDEEAVAVMDPYGIEPTSAFDRSKRRGGETQVTFPGSPRAWTGGDFPPPDALAIYLPFHFFFPDLWGIYLFVEGIDELAVYIRRTSGWNAERGDWNLSRLKAATAARLFLYHHEAFHHKVESMATRLEVSHRQPLYRRGFLDVYESTIGTPECIEEALANAYAYRKVKEAFTQKDWRWGAVGTGLRSYMNGQPPGYNRAEEFIDDEAYYAARDAFAEQSFQASLPIVEKESSLWRLFTYAFSGITHINSYTNYLISRKSPLLDRIDLHRRCIGYRDLKDKLDALVGLSFKREGNGSHEIYETDDGSNVTLYYTSGEVPKGTLNSILKQADVDMNVYTFLHHRG